MGLKIWQESKNHGNSSSVSIECFNNKDMQVGFYTLQDKECLNLVPDDYPVTTSIIILEGAIKIFSHTESYVTSAHDIIILENIEESYCAEAVGFTRAVAVSSESNQDSQEDTSVTNMLTEVEEKDVYTMGHSRRVALYAKRIALAYESNYNVGMLGSAACMHDIGKINTPIEILQKPGKLTVEEYDIIKRHPLDSYEILKNRLGERVAIAACQHHERIDGSGYPYGLKGNEISIDARIIAIADTFDAMTCKRIYNTPSPALDVVCYLEQNLDKYDGVFVSILRRKVESGDMDDVLTAFVAKDV